MDKVYIVEANFDDPESSWWSMIGLYTDYSTADEMSKKWNDFFIESKKMFDIPKNYQPEYSSNSYGDEYISWFDSDEYYELQSNFRDIKYFTDITIREFDLNKEIFIDIIKSYSSENMINLMNQWNREYKIKELIK